MNSRSAVPVRMGARKERGIRMAGTALFNSVMSRGTGVCRLAVAVLALVLAAPAVFAQDNPFEDLPAGNAQNPFEEVAPPEEGQQQVDTEAANRIETIEFRGARRITQLALRNAIFSRVGDIYSETALQRDLITLWNQGRFDDIRLERERGQVGWIVRFVLQERPTIRTLQFEGVKAVTTSDILDRFRERNVGLSVEAQFDDAKLRRAQNVLKAYLAEEGRQFAEVQAQVEPLPPSSVAITLHVTEGPKVKVGKFTMTGNDTFPYRELRSNMKATKGMGIPHSIFFEELFPKSYDTNAVEYDTVVSIPDYYRERGYLQARVSDVQTNVVDIGGGKLRLPLIWPNRPGKRANVDLTIEEGKLHRLNNINFTGVEFFTTPEALAGPIFQMGPGDVYSTKKLEDGIDRLRELYGQAGYINFLANPNYEIVGDNDLVNLTLDVDEGDQFFVRRIDFAGNTTTRDKVIRRELMLDEGAIYNKQLWDLSVLRLNQLGYFDTLDEEDSVDVRTDNRTNTVDLTLNVKEKGKNTIQMSGGISGIQGSFLGFQYSTNNFLGLGESLSVNSSVGTRYKNVQFGFTEPYFLNRPITLGFTINLSQFNFNQAREASILAGANLIPLYQNIGLNNILNYATNSKGFTVFASYPLRRSFARVGLNYSYQSQSVVTSSTSAQNYFNYLNFMKINGPNQLDGIKTSSVTPSYVYNSVNNPMTPTAGTSFQGSLQFAGGPLGGNINQIMPLLDFTHYRRGLKANHVLAMHFYASYLTGYGGRVAAPMNRFFMGGQNDVRGFNLYSLSPIAFIPTTSQVAVLNNDGSARQQLYTDPNTGATQLAPLTQTIPTYQMVFPGGDTKFVANLEYRIQLFGPVTLAAFFDAGVNRLSNASQLAINPSRINALNQQFPEAAFANRAVIANSTQQIRTSTGIEFQVLMPIFNQPFRVYYAYNPTTMNSYVQPPIVADRSYFPNAASFYNSIAQFGQPIPYFEKKTMFRFTIGRTF